jgi:hypothetical protein
VSISDAQWQRWLERSAKAPRCALFEITFLGSDGGSVTAAQGHHVYVSNMPYITRGDDSPAHQEFDWCVVEEPSFTRRMGEQLEGRSTQSYGDLIVSNECTLGDEGQLLEAGVRDDWLSMNWDGRRIRMWLGDAGWPFADFRLVLDGRIVDVFDPGAYKLGFRIGDKSALLDRPVMTTLLGGDGPEAGDLMPLALGNFLENIRPRRTDTVANFYTISAVDLSGGIIEQLDDSIGRDPTVREDGQALSGYLFATGADTTANTIQATDHGLFEHSRVIFYDTGAGVPSPLTGPSMPFYTDPYWVLASGLTTNEFKVSATKGGAVVDLTTNPGAFSVEHREWHMDYANGGFFVVGNPLGMITCDCWGLRVGVGQDLMPSPGDVIREVLTSSLTNTPLTVADIDTANFTAVEIALGTEIQVSYYLTERTTFAELFDKLCLSAGLWWGFNREGLLQLGQLDLPAAGTPVYTFSTDDTARRSMKMLRRILPRAEIKLRVYRNWQVQTQFAGAVLPDARIHYGRDGTVLTGIAPVSSWADDPLSHLSVVRPEIYPTYLALDPGSVPQNEADRLATMFAEPNAIFGCDTHQAVYLLDIGDLIHDEHPQYTGNAIVVSMTERIDARCQVEFFCRREAVHPETDIPQAGAP